MKKVVINTCYGGFGVSEKARILYNQYAAVKGMETFEDCYGISCEISRHCSILIRVVEELGSEANGKYAKLYIEEIYGEIYRIDEYDGYESVIEPSDQTWITI
tara:strand:+ start:289 stop:597 length:309 start_codon:yes stop_codon:yes gene_type:complete